MKKVFLKLSENAQEGICAGVSFLIKLQASAPSVFLWILRIFQEHLFYRPPLDEFLWQF